jgi:acyl-CoA synthetase (NDP forming)
MHVGSPVVSPDPVDSGASPAMAFRSVEALFRPHSIALVGASDTAAGGWSKAIFENVRTARPDVAFYPINPKRESVWGVRCYPSFADLPAPVDLALVITPAASITATLSEGIAHGLKAATIYAAGFGEGGDVAGEARAVELAALTASGLRICGPNCMGTLSVAERLYLYPAARVRDVAPGGIGLVMQSGGVFQFWAQYAAARGLGLSYAVSSGNELDLDLADYVNFLVEDERTTLICCLAEGISRPRAFMAAAAKALENRKPILFMKIGRSEGAKAAAQSHTGSLAGDDRVFDAVCERFGIVRVSSLDDMIESALAFRSGRMPAAAGAVFVGYSGSARGMILDAADEIGLKLATLTAQTKDALAPFIDAGSLLDNPIDLGPMASRDPQRYSRICQIVAADPNVALLGVQAQLPLDGETPDPQWLRSVMSSTAKPVFGYARTQQNVLETSRVFQDATGMSFLQGIPRATRAALQLVTYARRLQQHAGRTCADCAPSRSVRDPIAAAGIRRPASELANSPDEALALAQRIGFPVALKLHSPKPIHKTEVGGVALGLSDRDAVEKAARTLFATIAASPKLACDGVLVQEMVEGLELIVGMRVDPQYGPVVLLGLGGIFVEALDDIVLRLLPVDATDVRAMLGELRGKQLLEPFRGRPARDVGAVVASVVALGSVFLDAGDALLDLEINPLTVLEEGRGVRAVDVRTVFGNEA